MKKFSFMLLAIVFTAFTACSSKSSADKDKETKAPEKPATTNNATTPTPEPGTTTANLKEHVCTDKCKDGAHVYAHGEKGHTCTEECMKKAG